MPLYFIMLRYVQPFQSPYLVTSDIKVRFSLNSPLLDPFHAKTPTVPIKAPAPTPVIQNIIPPPSRPTNALPNGPPTRHTRPYLPPRPHLPYQPRERQQRQQAEHDQQYQNRQRIVGVALDYLELAVGLGAAVGDAGKDGFAYSGRTGYATARGCRSSRG